ncbi:MAG: hypothetical protein AABX79_02740 [Nanoarchaeota archaeon]
MIELVKIAIGIIVLIMGIPIGNYLAKQTKEELSQGQRWFKILILLSLAGSVAGLVLKNDALFFSFLFIAIVTSRSLRNKK